jgi:methionyl-tRNA formyltransferase
VPALEALVADGHSISLVVSRPDRRRGRGGATSPSPVKEAAYRLGLPVTDRLSDVAEAGVDLGVVVAYGRIIPEAVLERVPMLNLHFSLLPRWRGAAPVERAILAGDRMTGVCVMRLEAGLDTGPVYAREAVEIEPDETAAELSTRLAAVGSELLVRVLHDVRISGSAGALPEPEAQVGEATYAAKIEAADRALDWASSAIQLARIVRIGGAFTAFRGRRLGIERARAVDSPQSGPLPPGSIEGSMVATGEGRLQLVTVRPESGRSMTADEWLHGLRPRAGDRLGT